MPKEVGIKQLQEAGDAVIVALAGFIKKQGMGYFVGHWTTWFDGVVGGEDIPAEWVDLTDEELETLKAHWIVTLEEHGLGDENVEFIVGHVLELLKLAWEVYDYYTKKAALASENDSTKAGEPK